MRINLTTRPEPGRRSLPTLILAAALLAMSCSGDDGVRAPSDQPSTATPTMEWAIAVHGGAGSPSREMSEETRQAYEQALLGAIDLARKHLSEGGAAIDAVELVVVRLEDDERFNAGKGAVYTHDETHELDAAIMDGSDRSCGAVAGLRTVRNPIRLARLVMDRSPHVFMVGRGAEEFATEMKVKRVDNHWFDTEERLEALRRAQEKDHFGTVGAVALDQNGDLAAATSTGGLTNKRWGRVGDVPVIGAGTYADNSCCAISGTGRGEQFIRHTIARSIAALVEGEQLTLAAAAHRVFEERLDPGDGGVILVGPTGEIVLHFNTDGMYRAWANSEGDEGFAIWKDTE
ncbi:MAG: isoaspartyl peptidase/L-asparaginase [Thermoanaerobaculia bacterium]|nr:isoaspartyl peptidase/L-asparaginase [Thermoanaerobaculia bacterium]